MPTDEQGAAALDTQAAAATDDATETEAVLAAQETSEFDADVGNEPEPEAEPAAEDFDLFSDDVPASVANLEAALEEGRLSFRIRKDVWDSFTPEQKPAVMSLRRAVADKGREAARAREEAVRAREDLAKQRAAFQKDLRELQAAFGAEAVTAKLAPPEGPAPTDRFSEEARAYFAQKEVSERVGPVIEALRNAATARLAEADKQAAEAHKQTQRDQLLAFAAANPSFKARAEEVIGLMNETRPTAPDGTKGPPTLTYQRAFELLQARDPDTTAHGKLSQRLGAAATRTTAPPEGATPSEIYEFFVANPAARRKRLHG